MQKTLIFTVLFCLMSSFSIANKTTQSDKKTTYTQKRNLELTFIIVEYSKEKGDSNRFSITQKTTNKSDIVQNFSLILPVMLGTNDVSTIKAALKIGNNLWTIENESIIKIGEGRLIVSTSINVKDGEEGSVKLITKEPYNTIKTIGNIQQNIIEFIDVGIDIKVKPKVELNNRINSDIELKLSEVMRESEEKRNVHVPVISSRDLSTNIDFKPGKLELLGELSVDKKIKVRSGIPFLRSIPLLGPILFSSFREQVIKTKLYIVAGVKFSDQSKISSFKQLKQDNIDIIKDKTIFR